MYSVLVSKFEIAYPIIKNELKRIIKSNSKIVVIPWSFAVELETKKIEEFFNDRRKAKYLQPLYDLGIPEENIVILDCYNDNKEYMIDKINESDVILLTGGNPEMLYNKVVNAGIKETIKNYKKIVIGSSAGAELQLNKYFITKKNNYYKRFDWYDGFGVIKDDFYFDVHSVSRGRYLPSLEKKSKEINKTIYCLFDDGIIIYNRKTKKVDLYGKVVKFER